MAENMSETPVQLNKRLDKLKAASAKAGTLFNPKDWEPKPGEGKVDELQRIAGRKSALENDPYSQEVRRGLAEAVERDVARQRAAQSPHIDMMGAHADDLRSAAVENYNAGNISVEHAQDVIRHATAAASASQDASARHAQGDYVGASARLKESADSLRDGAVKLLSGRSVQGAAADATFGTVPTLLTGAAHDLHQGYVDNLPK